MSAKTHDDDAANDQALRSAVDIVRFVRLAGDDAAGFVRMMEEYLAETRRMAGMWPNLLLADQQNEVLEQLHMCKGGAAIFGFSRIMSMLGELEKNRSLSADAFDACAFEHELVLVEHAIAAWVGGRLT